MEEPYEALVAAIALIDSAMEQVEGHEMEFVLRDARNELNEERVALLGNGANRPFYVSDILAS